MKKTIVICDFCKTEQGDTIELDLAGTRLYDMCGLCRAELRKEADGELSPVVAISNEARVIPEAPPPAPKKGAKKKEEPVLAGGFASADLVKLLNLDMRQSDIAGQWELVAPTLATSYPGIDAAKAAYEAACENFPILFDGEIPRHKDALKALLSSFGVDFATLEGRTTASEMKEKAKLEGVKLSLLPEWVSQQMVGF
jgi:hypothetical protein